ncbi:hypothetical protein PHISCL_06151 [Aspergillus sclerotialis]|uniref:Uncharacterized protein n=1 Tax=Aspergillus sclerotialis TaxID=2070753 RepID=A0A3A2ZED2_9EURO|nr:hypothetical protein PHISCL_06151 [Aspergillus sclerotialis]
MPPKSELASPSLLSPAAYDDDASSLRSPSEQDSDSEDDEYLSKSRTTLELAQHDRSVLEDEEELEKLLTRSGPRSGLRRIFSPNASSVRIGKQDRRKQQREERRNRDKHKRNHEQTGEDGELMYEMEEGYRDDSSLLSTPSEDFREKEAGDYAYAEPKRVSWSIIAFASATIFIFFLILVLGAYKASSGFRASHLSRLLRSNGTALFAPTTILISLDGFRADFLDRGLTPTLNGFVAEGVSPQYMLPSFPSVTFPNHFTLVTGLYPESHGIVGNTFWDPEFQEAFYYTDTNISMQAKWWNAEPLWNTAEKQGVRSAIHMWPGSEAHIGGMDPTYLDQFNGSEMLPRKVDRILELIDLPGAEEDSLDVAERPQFIAAYVPNVDADGHNFGPNSTEIRSTISEVDAMLGNLFTGIEERNLTDIVNIVIVSDHGMATTATERLVQLDDFIDLSLVAHLDGWPSRGIRPKNPEDLPVLQEQLATLESNYSHAVEIYTKETMPERYHFTNSDRIAPLWVIPKAGWAIVERPDFDVHDALEKGETYSPRGVHGYDHENPLMRAIFIARGPAFPHPPNSRVDVFQNINVYNIVCDSLGIKAQLNNGTLHLPLEPQGLHSDDSIPTSVHEGPTSTETPGPASTTMVAPESTPPATEEPPTPNPESEDEKGTTWWAALWGKFNEFKDWAGGVISSVKDIF